MRTKILTWKEKEWAYDQWCEGKTQAQIAEALNVSLNTLRRALHGRPKIKPVLQYEEGGATKC